MFESGIWKVSDFAALVLLQSVNSLFSNTGLVLQANHSYSARVSLTWLFQSFKHSNLFINEVAREVCHNCRELPTYVAEIAIIRGRCARTIFIHESALNQKKRTTERSERVSFFDTPQRVTKNHSCALSMIWCFYFIHTEIYTFKYKANDCENTSFVQSETRTIGFHKVNLSVYGVKSFSILSDINLTFSSFFFNSFGVRKRRHQSRLFFRERWRESTILHTFCSYLRWKWGKGHLVV